MEEQNRVNKEKDRNTQRQETEVVTEREKVGEGAIREVRTHDESAPKPNSDREKVAQKKNISIIF